MSLKGSSLELGGFRYHISDQGNGNDVALLLHGMPDDSSCWKYQVPALLDAGFRVVVPDTLGYGLSDKPQHPDPYVAGTLVGHLFELIQRLELKDIRLVAHDWGAALGWAMVLERPDLFRRFVSLSVGHLRCFVGQAFDEPTRAIQAVKENWFMYLNTQADAAELYMANDCAFYRNVMMSTHPEVDEVCRRMSDPVNMNAMLNYDRANPVGSWYLDYARNGPGLPNCQVPTMVIYPEQDMFLWEEQAADTPQFVDAECQIVKMQGSHWAMLDHPDEFNRLMLDWLS